MDLGLQFESCFNITEWGLGASKGFKLKGSGRSVQGFRRNVELRFSLQKCATPNHGAQLDLIRTNGSEPYVSNLTP